MFYLRRYRVESAATGEEATGTAAGAGRIRFRRILRHRLAAPSGQDRHRPHEAKDDVSLPARQSGGEVSPAGGPLRCGSLIASVPPTPWRGWLMVRSQPPLYQQRPTLPDRPTKINRPLIGIMRVGLVVMWAPRQLRGVVAAEAVFGRQVARARRAV